MEPYSFGYQRVSIDKRYDKPPVIYRGPDVVENFIRHLLEEEKEIRDILSRIEPMIITEYDKLDYKYAKNVMKSPLYRFFAIFKQFTGNFNKNLADEGQKHFNYLSKTFPDPDVFSLLLRKGVFPYDYVDTEQKLKNLVYHPKKIFNKLGDTHISDEDYQFAQTVWGQTETPERKHIQVEHLSPYSKELLQNLTGKQCLTKIEKLVPNLYDKEKYIVHYRNLQLYVELGMKIKKIHRVLKFKQSPWLKKYIDFNTEKRKIAKNEFEKCLYKLMNNSIFGRTLLNTRKHKDVKLCHTEEKLNKETAKPSYASCKIFNEHLVAVEKKRVNVLMKQPIYVGFCILDLSKFLMYDFHYNHMKSLYGDKIRVCFSDTDSFLYHVETEDVYEDMHQYQDMYDTSDYPPEHFYMTPKIKK
ncbi:unnamed protein product [Mytilus edulis]|uniref:DNA-directed DNA polymerase n=1 Tax=Mytilus edulis TaxID=6550 RepID=A0A8S3V978_MYTED|nr:unnamed protein product [Mytilus edulis]